jgi:AcrR family transcriptional regulator
MTRSKEATRQAILDAAEAVLRKRGAHAMTMEAVARESKCAKGLVTYHFQTKTKLFVESVLSLAAAREAAWTRAFDTPNPQDAIDRTWEVLKREAESGTLKAWTSLVAMGSDEIDQAVNNSSSQFRSRVTKATQELLARAGLRTTIPVEQLGWLLAAVVQGMGFQIAGGGALDVLENAYAAAWLGLLALTEPLD